jgi:hypothetical protein
MCYLRRWIHLQWCRLCFESRQFERSHYYSKRPQQKRNNCLRISQTCNSSKRLSSDQKNSFFVVVPSVNDKVNKVNQWISATDANTVIVAVDYATFPSSTSTLFIGINANILSSSFANVGYTATENSFLSVVVSNSIAQAPAGLAVPLSATVNKSTKPIELVANKALRLNAQRTLKDLAA